VESVGLDSLAWLLWSTVWDRTGFFTVSGKEHRRRL